MITKKFAFEKQQGFYHNKVNLSLTPVQRLGDQSQNCKMDYCHPHPTPNSCNKFTLKCEAARGEN